MAASAGQPSRWSLATLSSRTTTAVTLGTWSLISFSTSTAHSHPPSRTSTGTREGRHDRRLRTRMRDLNMRVEGVRGRRTFLAFSFLRVVVPKTRR